MNSKFKHRLLLGILAAALIIGQGIMTFSVSAEETAAVTEESLMQQRSSEVYGLYKADGSVVACDSMGEVGEGSQVIERETITKLFVGSDVEVIGHYAFIGCNSLVKVDLRNAANLESIAESAFMMCGNLTSVDLSNAVNLTTIDMSAFMMCGNLTSIDLSNAENLETIRHMAFQSCTQLGEVTFGTTAPPYIGDGAFMNTKDGIRIHLPGGARRGDWTNTIDGATNPFFDVALSATAAPGVTKVYDGTPDFTKVSLTLTGLEPGDIALATAELITLDADVGKAKPFTTEHVTLYGGVAVYYRLAKEAVTGSVEITSKPLSADMLGGIGEQAYTGSEVKPIPVVTDGNPSIIREEDYTVSYQNNTKAGIATVIVTAKADGNYSGTVSKEFSISKGKGNVTEPVVSSPNVTYGDRFTVTFTPTASMQKDVASRTSRHLETAVNTAELYLGETRIAGESNVTVNTPVTFTVGTAEKSIPADAFDGTAQTFTIQWGGNENLQAGQGTVQVTLHKKALTAKTGPGITKVYDGTNYFSDAALVIDTDKVVGGDTVTAVVCGTAADAKAGKAKALIASSVTLTGPEAGYYSLTNEAVTGTVTITKKPLKDSMIAIIGDQTYTGTAIEPVLRVIDGSPNILTSEDYTVSYRNHTEVGTAAATITANNEGNYSGTGSREFIIKASQEPIPPKPGPKPIPKLEAKKGAEIRSPKTGDFTSLAGILLLFIFSGSILLCNHQHNR